MSALAEANDQREVSRKMIDGLCELRDELKRELAEAKEREATARAEALEEAAVEAERTHDFGLGKMYVHIGAAGAATAIRALKKAAPPDADRPQQ